MEENAERIFYEYHGPTCGFAARQMAGFLISSLKRLREVYPNYSERALKDVLMRCAVQGDGIYEDDIPTMIDQSLNVYQEGLRRGLVEITLEKKMHYLVPKTIEVGKNKDADAVKDEIIHGGKCSGWKKPKWKELDIMWLQNLCASDTVCRFEFKVRALKKYGYKWLWVESKFDNLENYVEITEDKVIARGCVDLEIVWRIVKGEW